MTDYIERDSALRIIIQKTEKNYARLEHMAKNM